MQSSMAKEKFNWEKSQSQIHTEEEEKGENERDNQASEKETSIWWTEFKQFSLQSRVFSVSKKGN